MNGLARRAARRRSRCSILIRHQEPGAAEPTLVLVDTSPDMRDQLLAARVDRLDAVLLTHEHADQCHGIDDLRALVIRHRRRMPIHMSQSTAEAVLRRFDYCFQGARGYPAILESRVDLEAGKAVRIGGPGGEVEVLALAQQRAGHQRIVRHIDERAGQHRSKLAQPAVGVDAPHVVLIQRAEQGQESAARFALPRPGIDFIGNRHVGVRRIGGHERIAPECDPLPVDVVAAPQIGQHAAQVAEPRSEHRAAEHLLRR